MVSPPPCKLGGCGGVGFRLGFQFLVGVLLPAPAGFKPEDIKPYMDPEFSNNVILTQTEFLTMNSRPKQPKYARNKNILVIGGSGSGKTRFFVKPNLMQMHSSYVVTDPNGNLQ